MRTKAGASTTKHGGEWNAGREEAAPTAPEFCADGRQVQRPSVRPVKRYAPRMPAQQLGL
jgi:hypothetical protein